MGKKAVKVALKSKGTTAIKRSKDHSTKTIQKNTKTNRTNLALIATLIKNLAIKRRTYPIFIVAVGPHRASTSLIQQR